MKHRTFREIMIEKLDHLAGRQQAPAIVSIPFQKWTGWKSPTQPILVQSYLVLERQDDGIPALFVVRAYADDESPAAWRDFYAFDYAGDICTLSELVVEMRNHPDFFDTDYPLEVTEYDSLIENLTELVANDALIRSCRA